MYKDKLSEKIKEPDEKLLFSKALDRAHFCMKNYTKTFTDFLSPVTASYIAEFAESENSVNTKFFGGAAGCERVMAAFAPEYEETEESDYPIACLKISYSEKFSKKLTHRDFLGSLMGMGIVRGKVGDICLKDGYSVAFVSEDIADYICINLEKVGHTSVKCERYAVPDDFSVFSSVKRENIIVSSMRTDAIVAAAFKLSRNEASALIKGGKVFADYICQDSVSKEIKENCLISVRGHGRIRIIETGGKTKSNRIVLNIERYV